MKTPSNNKRRIILRYALFVGIMFFFSSLIVFKMFKTTVVYAHDWNLKADSILTKVSVLEPTRGKILADNGTVLAANMQYYIARIDWGYEKINGDTLYKYMPALCDSLAAFEPSLTAEQWQQKLTEAYTQNSTGKKHHSYRLIKRLLSNREFERLCSFPYFKNDKRKHYGLYREAQLKRRKPFGAMAARSIGNVGEKDGSLHGTSGLEMALDSLLYGKPGTSTKQQLTSTIVNVADVKAIPGYDITTTINVDIQDIVETELYSMCVESNAEWGTAVLMEVATGEIKAISNLEKNKTTGDYVEGRNNAVLGYEPGSVVKPISMMMALEDGIVKSPNHVFETGSVWVYAGKSVKDHYGAPSLSAEQIIARSSNIGMSRIIVSKYNNNPGGFYDRLKEMGFFEPFNTGIGGEQKPVVRRLGNSNADRVALTRMSYGYTTLIPPLYTLAMYNAMANDGKFVRPHLVKKLSREGEPDSIIPITYIREQVCSPRNAAYMRQMLHAVVWDDHGTAHKFLQDNKVEIAGKTGTAFTNTNGSYSQSDKRYAFCGFFPYAAPKYSCIVLMKGANRGAAACSGMVLKNIALRLYARGMLGNVSNFVAETDSQGNKIKAVGETPVLYSNAEQVKKELNISNYGVFRGQQQPKNGVPNVRGKSVREAIAILEANGLNVRFNGSGHVVAQSLPAGSQFKRGDNITLTLRY